MDEIIKQKYKQYIISNYKQFNVIGMVEVCSGNSHSRSQVSTYFKTIIEELINDDDTVLLLKKWCRDVINGNYEVLTSDVINQYWTLKSSVSASITKELLKKQKKVFKNQQKLNIMSAVDTAMPSTSSRPQNSSPTDNKMKKDQILFGQESVSTKLKRIATSKFSNYINLSDNDKQVVDLGLNGILNLSDDSDNNPQKKLFDDEEWTILKNKYGGKVDEEDEEDEEEEPAKSEFSTPLSKVNKALKRVDYTKAYNIARNYEISSSSSNSLKKLMSIYAHIINVYRNRKVIFNNHSTKSEYDALMKLWGELFELLFDGNDKVEAKWGESVMTWSTIAKKENKNEDKKRVIGYKVDGRVVSRSNGLDCSPLESARYFTDSKIDDDRSKLSIESKIIIDQFIRLANYVKIKHLVIPAIQTQANKVEIIKTKIVDEGLYVTTHMDSLTLPASPVEFAEISDDWFKTLLDYLRLCEYLADLSNQCDDNSQESFSVKYKHKKRKVVNKNYRKYIRGTFFPPCSSGSKPVFPSYLYESPSPSRSTDE